MDLMRYVAWRLLQHFDHGLKMAVFAQVAACVGVLLVHLERCRIAQINVLFSAVRYEFLHGVCVSQLCLSGLVVVLLRMTFWSRCKSLDSVDSASFSDIGQTIDYFCFRSFYCFLVAPFLSSTHWVVSSWT